MVRVKNPQDFWAGLLFLVIGLLAVYFGRNYAFGAATKMGPGYLPTVLSWMMAGLGAFLRKSKAASGVRRSSSSRPSSFSVC